MYPNQETDEHAVASGAYDDRLLMIFSEDWDVSACNIMGDITMPKDESNAQYLKAQSPIPEHPQITQ